MPKQRPGEIIEYEGELFVILCHKCWQSADLIMVNGDVRTKCCQWLVGKLFDEEHKRFLMEQGTLQ